ncbi:3-hydroxybutyryl-CoA dehydrogenase [Daejeonella rubra]|uniref:L-gulonate 3-dehydrogenase n=1 Tax=Daejeonella rubra TaxID=990371 RepID=A0A1G9TKF4_9SPHI|nr:3-hydroxyacyl-CoA dehydrogenase family protein [Daejeonella rubra]SDM48211.1 3-hydroxybutyryl-CoA dehydrogenase [Daejeonella rubra]
MEKLAIIGSGTMGHSIAVNAAWAGLNVKMYGLNEADLQKGLEGIKNKLILLSQNGLISPRDIEEIQSRISITQSIEEAVNDVSFVIECIPEDLGLKQQLFNHLDEICAPDVILATNTSGLSLSLIAAGTKNPERTIVAHFWNPAHLVPLVEVLRTDKTSEDTFNRTIALLKFMHKKPIEVKKEVPGLVGNRLQFALFREAQYLLEEGIASKEDIDAAVTYSIGRRLPVTGPLLSADMGGLDVFASISDYLFEDLSKSDRSFPTLKKLVEQKKLGNKTAEGYYEWDEDFSTRVNQAREKELIRHLKQDRGIE